MSLKKTHRFQAANLFLPRRCNPLNMLITICISSTINRGICFTKSGAALPQFIQFFTFAFSAISLFWHHALILTVFIICQPIHLFRREKYQQMQTCDKKIFNIYWPKKEKEKKKFCCKFKENFSVSGNLGRN